MKKFHLHSDEKLIHLYHESGDKSILSHLFKKYRDKLFGLAYYYLHDRDHAMDMVMDTYETVLKKLDDTAITNFKSWIYSITRHKCLNQLRKKVSTQELKEFHSDFMENNSAEVYDTEERIEKLMEALSQLKPDQRKCIELFYLKGTSYKDIAIIANLEEKKVKSQIQNGKRNLQILLTRVSFLLLIMSGIFI